MHFARVQNFGKLILIKNNSGRQHEDPFKDINMYLNRLYRFLDGSFKVIPWFIGLTAISLFRDITGYGLFYVLQFVLGITISIYICFLVVFPLSYIMNRIKSDQRRLLALAILVLSPLSAAAVYYVPDVMAVTFKKLVNAQRCYVGQSEPSKRPPGCSRSEKHSHLHLANK